MYKIKRLIEGFRTGLPRISLVAVPRDKGHSTVIFEGNSMSLIGKKPMALSKPIKDRYGRGSFYTLQYYKWKPDAYKTSLI